MHQDREGGSGSDALRKFWVGQGRPKEGEGTAKEEPFEQEQLSHEPWNVQEQNLHLNIS